MLKISLLFRKYTKFLGKTREFLGLRSRNFQGVIFLWTQTYREIFKSALLYLYRISSVNVTKSAGNWILFVQCHGNFIADFFNFRLEFSKLPFCVTSYKTNSNTTFLSLMCSTAFCMKMRLGRESKYKIWEKTTVKLAVYIKPDSI